MVYSTAHTKNVLLMWLQVNESVQESLYVPTGLSIRNDASTQTHTFLITEMLPTVTSW